MSNYNSNDKILKTQNYENFYIKLLAARHRADGGGNSELLLLQG